MFVELPSRRKRHAPWATFFIVATCVVVFLWLANEPADVRLRLLTHWGTVPATLLDAKAPWLQQLYELRAARLGLVLPLGVFLEFVRVPASLLIGFWVLLQLLFTYVGPAFGAVAWSTHIAGFVIGIVFALLSKPAVARRLRE
jgi:membrane associated rhomboid family serine protease